MTIYKKEVNTRNNILLFDLDKKGRNAIVHFRLEGEGANLIITRYNGSFPNGTESEINGDGATTILQGYKFELRGHLGTVHYEIY